MSNTETSSSTFKEGWLARKESYQEQLAHYEKAKKVHLDNLSFVEGEIPKDELAKSRLLNNNIAICKAQINICELTLKVDELRDKNIKLKVGINDS